MRLNILITTTRFTSLTGLILLVSGCALLPFGKQGSTYPFQTTDQILQAYTQHTQKLDEFNNWVITGRIGVKGPEGAFSGSFKWIQLQDTFSITVSGPLGQGATTVQGDKLEATLTNGQTGEISWGKPQTLMNQALGWSLPMQHIQQWIKGHPGEEMANVRIRKGKEVIFYNYAPKTDLRLNKENALALLKNGNWRIEYNKYKPFENKVYNVSLPHKVIASNKSLTLTFIIKNWSKPTP